MNKIYTIIVVCVMMASGLSALPASTAFANENNQNASSREATIETITDQEYYMSLNDPKLTASVGDTLVVANDKDLFINKGGVGTDYPNILTTSADLSNDYNISQIAMIGNDLIMLVSATAIGKKLVHMDISTNVIKALPLMVGDVDTTPRSISSGSSTFMVTVNDVLHNCEIKGNNLVSKSSTTISGDTESLAEIHTFDNITYVATGRDIFKIVDTMFVMILTATNDIVDYFISGNLAFIATNTNISSYKIDEKKPVTSETLNPSTTSITVFDGNLLATAPAENKVRILDTTTLVESNYYGDSGDGLKRLDSPTDVAYHGNEIYIADNKNNRIIIHNSVSNVTSKITLNIAPNKVTVTKSGKVFIIGEDKLVYEVTGNTAKLVTGSKDSADLETYGDYVISLTKTDIIIIDSNNNNQVANKISGTSTITSIVVPLGTNLLYAINPVSADAEIAKYNLETMQLVKSYKSPSPDSIHNFDYIGNLYLTDTNSVKKCTFNSSDGGSYSDPITLLKSTAVSGNISTTININNGEMYIVSKDKHLLYKITSDEIISIENSSYSPPTDWTVMQVAMVNSDHALALTVPDNLQTARSLKKNETVLLLAEVGDYYYVTYATTNLKEYVLKSYLTAPFSNVDMDEASMSPFNKTDVFAYPSVTAPKTTTLASQQVVTTLSMLAATDAVSKDKGVWDWYKIEFTEAGTKKTGYIQTKYIDHVAPSQPESSIVFLKTKAKNVGEKIKLYSKPDISSEIIFKDIDDGLDIQIYGEYDPDSTFTRVNYKEQIGYVLTENLQEAGLTPSQIIAISVTCSCIAAFGLIGLLLFLMKRNKVKKQADEYKE